MSKSGAPGRIRTSDQELRRLLLCPLSYGGNPLTVPVSGAGEGNRTPVASLEGWSSTIELHPRESEDSSVTTSIRQPSGWPDLNRRPPAPKAGALPSCATARPSHCASAGGRIHIQLGAYPSRRRCQTGKRDAELVCDSCGRWDSNPQRDEIPPDPKSGAYASSATPALGHSVSNLRSLLYGSG